MAGAVVPSPAGRRASDPNYCIRFLCFATYHSFQFDFELLLGLAVLPNPVPDRQPHLALCRMASLGPLVQTEVVAGFPEKVSDWTVIYFFAAPLSLSNVRQSARISCHILPVS
ncbi:MAG: hypothetical protein K2M42_09870 [Oscillospiraceae bacterium]|nr:hypothetical protein [Oscillospiraceae bacterium]